MSQLMLSKLSLLKQQAKSFGSFTLFARHLSKSNETLKSSDRPLVLLLPWVASINKVERKYQEFWQDRGFDVLTVKTDVKTAMVPPLGGPQRANRMYDFMKESSLVYDQIIVHALSVGSYSFAELLLRIDQGKAQGEKEAFKLSMAIKGMIIDSYPYCRYAGAGIATSVSSNPIWVKVARPLYYAMILPFKHFTLNYYARAEMRFEANLDRIPGLMLYSLDDPVSNVANNRRILETWHKNGVITMSKYWEKSVHVAHFRVHHAEYVETIDRFLASLPNQSKNTKTKGRGELIKVIY